MGGQDNSYCQLDAFVFLQCGIGTRGVGSSSELGVLYQIQGCYRDHQVKFVWRKTNSYGGTIKAGGAPAPEAPLLPTPMIGTTFCGVLTVSHDSSCFPPLVFSFLPPLALLTYNPPLVVGLKQWLPKKFCLKLLKSSHLQGFYCH